MLCLVVGWGGESSNARREVVVLVVLVVVLVLWERLVCCDSCTFFLKIFFGNGEREPKTNVTRTDLPDVVTV